MAQVVVALRELACRRADRVCAGLHGRDNLAQPGVRRPQRCEQLAELVTTVDRDGAAEFAVLHPADDAGEAGDAAGDCTHDQERDSKRDNGREQDNDAVDG
jgi:hypothetical protein